MRFGMNDAQFRILDDVVVKPLKNCGADVYIFGSRITGKFHPHSDVDVLYSISGKRQIPLHEISNIKEAIEESRFPFTVDLVNEDDLAVSYRDQILAARVQL